VLAKCCRVAEAGSEHFGAHALLAIGSNTVIIKIVTTMISGLDGDGPSSRPPAFKIMPKFGNAQSVQAKLDPTGTYLVYGISGTPA
jgi:hypothetical protein